MKIRKPLEVIGRDPELTLEFIDLLRTRAQRVERKKQIIERVTSPFKFWKGVTL